MKKTCPFVTLSFLSFLLLFIVGCTSTSTPEASQVPKMIIGSEPHTLEEVEAMSGLDVSEPAYLPEGVSFDFVTYQQAPVPSVTSQFKLVHEQYGEMGRFLQIVKEAQNEVPADTVSCGEDVDGCEMIQIRNVQVKYHLYSSGTEGVATEGLDWYSNGFSYRLLRTAGEPNKLYKDELIKVVQSMQ